MRVFCFVTFTVMSIALPLFVFYALTATETSSLVHFDFSLALPITSKMILILPYSLAWLFFLFVTYFLYRFFDSLSLGQIFTLQNVQLLRKSSCFYFAGNVIYILSSMIVFFGFPDLRLQEKFHLHLKLQMFLVPIFLFLVSSIIHEGQKLKEAQ